MVAPNKNSKFEKMYIITKDRKGHFHRYVSSRASQHSDIIVEYGIDLNWHTILEKGFILGDHAIIANFDIRKRNGGCRKIR